MKVKDFLENFKDINPEVEMIFSINSGCCGDTEDLGQPWFGNSNELYYQVFFEAMPHMDTCRKVGTLRQSSSVEKNSIKMSDKTLEQLLADRAQKWAEERELTTTIEAIYRELWKTCAHPNKQSTPYEYYCDYCGWSKTRSF